MGAQRRRAYKLMQTYKLTEQEAYDLGEKFEALELGDEISDCLFYIEEGDPNRGIENLYGLRKRLNEAIDVLENALADVELKE
jgi:predicted subunit of tRNA(5-methylaminomethyl-2-thiouridylate) methyltransferase